jgi:hypothetical protein
MRIFDLKSLKASVVSACNNADVAARFHGQEQAPSVFAVRQKTALAGRL